MVKSPISIGPLNSEVTVNSPFNGSISGDRSPTDTLINNFSTDSHQNEATKSPVSILAGPSHLRGHRNRSRRNARAESDWNTFTSIEIGSAFASCISPQDGSPIKNDRAYKPEEICDFHGSNIVTSNEKATAIDETRRKVHNEIHGTPFSSANYRPHAPGNAKGASTVTERDIERNFPFIAPSEGCTGKYGRKMRNMIPKCSFDLLLSIFPIASVLQTYSKENILPDLTSGISEGIMAVPQGMSYALLANMPPQYGLYNGLMFPLVYLIFGTSMHASLGVSSIENILTAQSIQQANFQNETLRIEATIALSLCVGIIQILLGFLESGVLSSLLADSVLSGFTTASAFIIGTSQLKHVFDFSPPPGGTLFDIPYTWWYFIVNVQRINPITVTLTVLGVIILVVFQKINKRWFRRFPFPNTLFLLGISIFIIWIAALDKKLGIRVVGDIPNGFPRFIIPSFTLTHKLTTKEGVVIEDSKLIIFDLLLQALPLAVMFYIIHISISKSVAQQKNNYIINPTKEWKALGCANIFGSFFRCFPCATSLSRTSVISEMGAKTILHNIPYSFIICLTLWFITPLLFFIPYSILASVVFYGVYGMINFKAGYQIIRLGGLDSVLWLITFSVALLIGSMEGIITSFILSVLWLLKESSRPSTAILGQLPNTHIYRNIKRFPMAKEIPGIRIFRFDASINFSNADYFEKKISQMNMNEIQILIIDGSSINRLDMTAVRILQKLAKNFAENSKLLLLANWKGSMRDFLERIKFYENVPLDRCFLSLHDAVCWSRAYLHSISVNICPESDVSSFTYRSHPSRNPHTFPSTFYSLDRISDTESSPFSRGGGDVRTPTTFTRNHKHRAGETASLHATVTLSFPHPSPRTNPPWRSERLAPPFASLGEKEGVEDTFILPHLLPFSVPPPPVDTHEQGKRGEKSFATGAPPPYLRSPPRVGAYSKSSSLKTYGLQRSVSISLPAGPEKYSSQNASTSLRPLSRLKHLAAAFPWERSPSLSGSFWRRTTRHRTFPQQPSSPCVRGAREGVLPSLRRRLSLAKGWKDSYDNSPGERRRGMRSDFRARGSPEAPSVAARLSSSYGTLSTSERGNALATLSRNPPPLCVDPSTYFGNVYPPPVEKPVLLEPCGSIHEIVGDCSPPYGKFYRFKDDGTQTSAFKKNRLNDDLLHIRTEADDERLLWDGLSARTPLLQIVKEITDNGNEKTWKVIRNI